MVAAPDGPAPPFAASPLALGPGRDRALSEDDLPPDLRRRLQQGERLRLWFAVGDALAAAGDTGLYSLLIERTLSAMSDTTPVSSLQAPRIGDQIANKTRVPVTYMLACLKDGGLDFKPESTTTEQTVAGLGYTAGQKTISHS